MSKYTTNQDIRDYMADNCVTQKMLGESMGVSIYNVNKLLKSELPEQTKETIIHHVDAIVADRNQSNENAPVEDCSEEEEDFTEDPEVPEEGDTYENSTKFQIGDRVKIPSKSLIIGKVSDIWKSCAKRMVMYSVNTEDGRCCMYEESQLEPAPLPIEYSFEAHVELNVAIVTMVATQGENTWVHARGHAHILHDGPVGLAQAVSFASKRMFESLDTKQEKQIYSKPRKDGK